MKKKLFTSLDYPLYEKMVDRAPHAAKLWLIGDFTFQIGFLLIIIFLPILFYFYKESGFGLWAKVGTAGLIISFLTICVGVYIKRESYKEAIKAGIDVSKI